MISIYDLLSIYLYTFLEFNVIIKTMYKKHFKTFQIVFGVLVGAVCLFAMGIMWVRSDNNSPPTQESLLLEGKLLYLTSCEKCHGAQGQGTPSAPSLIHTSRVQTPADITAIVTYGIPGTHMPSWKNKLQAKDIQKISEFVFKLRSQPSHP